MINEQLFKEAWARLDLRWPGRATTDLGKMYYVVLNEEMTTEQFQYAVGVVFRNREFFPRPVDFVEAVREDVQSEAMDQWEIVQKVMSGNHAFAVEELSEAGRRVLRVMGGEMALRKTGTSDQRFIRAEFLRLYETAAQAERQKALSGTVGNPKRLPSREAAGRALDG